MPYVCPGVLWLEFVILVYVCVFVQDEEVDEEDEFYTAHNNTIMQRGGGKKKDDTMVTTEDTITNLGTLVIIDDAGDMEDEMDTMKREIDGVGWRCGFLLCERGATSSFSWSWAYLVYQEWTLG